MLSNNTSNCGILGLVGVECKIRLILSSRSRNTCMLRGNTPDEGESDSAVQMIYFLGRRVMFTILLNLFGVDNFFQQF